MPTTTKPIETRAIGWYAVQRVRVADWFRGHGQKAPVEQSAQPSEFATQHRPPTGTKVPSPESEMSEMTETEDKDIGPSRSKDRNKNGADEENQSEASPEEQLRNVVEESHTVLAKAHAVFPFDLFPDTVSLDRHKLTIVHREFFFVEQTVSVPIENIKNIEANIGPFLGSLTITSDLFTHNTQVVKYLTNREAGRFQKLVQGAVVAQREDIDLNEIDADKLCDMLIDLGSGHSHTISN